MILFNVTSLFLFIVMPLYIVTPRFIFLVNPNCTVEAHFQCTAQYWGTYYIIYCTLYHCNGVEFFVHCTVYSFRLY